MLIQCDFFPEPRITHQSGQTATLGGHVLLRADDAKAMPITTKAILKIIRVNKDIMNLTSVSPLKEVIEIFENLEEIENDKKLTA